MSRKAKINLAFATVLIALVGFGLCGYGAYYAWCVSRDTLATALPSWAVPVTAVAGFSGLLLMGVPFGMMELDAGAASSLLPIFAVGIWCCWLFGPQFAALSSGLEDSLPVALGVLTFSLLPVGMAGLGSVFLFFASLFARMLMQKESA